MEEPKVAEQADPRLTAAALADALRRSRWYSPASFQQALFEWSTTGLAVSEIRNWLQADVANPWAALSFRTLGINPDDVRASSTGESVTIGRVSVQDAARAILGPRGINLDQLRAFHLDQLLGEADSAGLRQATHRWWTTRVQRLDRVLEDHPAPPELADWLAEQPDSRLRSYRDEAVEWAGPVSIAVAQQELERLGGPPRPGGPRGSDPLMALVFGALSTRELTRRLGERVEAAIAAPPAYVTGMLGPYPNSELAQLTWTHAVLAIEAFRLECGIDDAEHALGPPDYHVPLPAREQFRAVNRAVTRARATLDRGNLDVEDAAEPDGRQRRSPGLPWDAEADVNEDWGAGQLVDPAAMRPEEELAWRLREAIPVEVLPARHVVAAAALSDEELAVRWGRAVERHLRGQLWDPLHAHGGVAAMWAAALDDEACTRRAARMVAIASEPPAYITSLLGPCPADQADKGAWLARADEIEEYRLLTGTTDPIHALGPAPPTDGSWVQCWRRELVQELADASFARMLSHHHIIGTPQEREQQGVLAASTADPWVGIRPAGGMVEESEALATGELRRRVAVALPLLVTDRPENRAGELREAQLRHATLLGYRQEEETALAAAKTRLNDAPRVGRGARAERTAAHKEVDRHDQALTRLDSRLLEASQELARLNEAQAAYFEWCREHALDLTQGQAAAHVLQERETRLLEDLAAYPPPYLLAELGQPPTNHDGLAA
jgi:hypothetical protein